MSADREARAFYGVLLERDALDEETALALDPDDGDDDRLVPLGCRLVGLGSNCSGDFAIALAKTYACARLGPSRELCTVPVPVAPPELAWDRALRAACDALGVKMVGEPGWYVGAFVHL